MAVEELRLRSVRWGGPYWGVMRWQMWRVSRAIIIFTSPRLQQTHTGHQHSIMSLWSWYWYYNIIFLYTCITRQEKRSRKLMRRVKSIMFPALTIFPFPIRISWQKELQSVWQRARVRPQRPIIPASQGADTRIPDIRIPDRGHLTEDTGHLTAG